MLAKKFFILVVNPNTDSMEQYDRHDRIACRSKQYASFEEAERKANEYIGASKADTYYIMECVAAVRSMSPPTETVMIKR